jgi:hypothetical protein
MARRCSFVVGALAPAVYSENAVCGGRSSRSGLPEGRASVVLRDRRTICVSRKNNAPVASTPAMATGSGNGADVEPRLHATAAHSLPDGAGAAASIVAVPEGVGVWVTIEPGTRHPTVTAAKVTNSQRHFAATTAGYTRAYGARPRGMGPGAKARRVLS